MSQSQVRLLYCQAKFVLDSPGLEALPRIDTRRTDNADSVHDFELTKALPLTQVSQSQFPQQQMAQLPQQTMSQPMQSQQGVVYSQSSQVQQPLQYMPIQTSPSSPMSQQRFIMQPQQQQMMMHPAQGAVQSQHWQIIDQNIASGQQSAVASPPGA